jgi:hypothetical protein
MPCKLEQQNTKHKKIHGTFKHRSTKGNWLSPGLGFLPEDVSTLRGIESPADKIGRHDDCWVSR